MLYRLLLSLCALCALRGEYVAAQPDKAVAAEEARRIAVIDKVRPAVVAACMYGGEAAGSGVLIDPEGYALTNFHVVAATGSILSCGLPDGQLYDAVVVGVDKVGDVALIKLLPKEEGKSFPFVPLGDSDKMNVGDWSLAMGNPFGLSLDFTPSVTYGLVSGVHRYQPPEGKGTLEYTDCLQFDTSINPGNSGGPLFNMNGELIGINGRGQFEKRMRINSGVGFAISINQIKNFLGHLYAGIDVDHATLGALVETDNEDGALSQLAIRQILEESDAFRRGLQPGDQIIRFAGRPLTSTNQYKNILGIFPKGWRVPMTYRRGSERKEILVRLMGNSDVAIEQPNRPPPPPRPGTPRPKDPKRKAKESPAAKLLDESKKGFANFHFNQLRQDKLLAGFKQSGDFAGLTGDWSAVGTIELADRKGEVKLTWADGADGLTEVRIARSGIEDTVRPLKSEQPLGELQLPQGSGGLLVALYQYRRLLIEGSKGFEGGFTHGGHDPLYPPRADGSTPEALRDLRVDCEVLRTRHGAFEAKWSFDRKDHRLLSVESWVAKEEDPCELYFADYRPADGRQLPHRIEVRHGDKRYAVLTIKSYQLGKK
ncbi:MAG TPA: trypsin-like peptidase domain-containing protein [Fimbriiglobus sp.]|nr:trypsin-like peptidase domain-containing protein [Fimbriiglobus sp.]